MYSITETQFTLVFGVCIGVGEGVAGGTAALLVEQKFVTFG